jgi:hypothetical protein
MNDIANLLVLALRGDREVLGLLADALREAVHEKEGDKLLRLLRLADQLQEILFGQGPDTQWSPDTLDEIVDAMRQAGLTPDDALTQKEREESWAPRITARVSRLQAAGNEELLDYLIHDLHGGEEAAAINNSGYRGQVEATFRALGPDQAEAQIEDLLDQTTGSGPGLQVEPSP